MPIAQAQSAGPGAAGTALTPARRAIHEVSPLLRPEIGARQAVGLTAMAAARAAEGCAACRSRSNGSTTCGRTAKKVCGILTEAALDLESGMLDYAVLLRLGFNVAAPAATGRRTCGTWRGRSTTAPLPRARGPRWRRRS